MKNNCTNASEIKDNDKLVWNELLPTWQPLAAIAYRTNLPIRTCEKILVQMYNDGKVKCSRVRIDGHNSVYHFKKIVVNVILGVKLPVDNSEQDVCHSEDGIVKHYVNMKKYKKNK